MKGHMEQQFIHRDLIYGVRKLHEMKLAYRPTRPRLDGVMDSVLACGAGEPGLIPAMSKWFFSLGYKVVGKKTEPGPIKFA